MLRYKNINASYGPAARTHGNKGRRSKWHLTVEQLKDLVQFVLYTGMC